MHGFVTSLSPSPLVETRPSSKTWIMMKLRMLFFVLATLPYRIWAQDLEIGGGIGIMVYDGELAPAEFALHPSNIRPGGGIFARFLHSHSLGTRLGLSYGILAGNEKIGGEQYERGLKFRSHLVEFSGLGELYLINQRYFRSKMIFSLYLSAGVAVFHFDPKNNATSTPTRLKPLHTEGQGLPGYGKPYSLLNVSIPYGFGFRFTKKSRWGYGAELLLRRSLTDYLDDVSAREVRYGDILENYGTESARWSNPLLTPTPDNYDVRYIRGDRKPDYYFTLGISISYRLINRGAFISHERGYSECPRF